ncbi:hypothetical protein HOE67_02865 [Candidatus Peregrinibacteria bacterium]|jgi:hypothetical protein|nr:hypothetical protein [Candidatus Peregrinibacteria bacterium]MBT4056028.1 hypothetical protein [Candidatus Peregrinibacteria bacterium]
MFKQNRLAYKDPAERPSASAESFDAKAARKEVINSITETNGTRAYRVVKGEIGKVNAGSYEAFYKKLLKEDPTKPDWETSGKYEVSIEISEYEPSENAIDAWIDSKGGEKFLKKLSKLGKGDMEAGLSQYDYKNHTNKIKKMAKELRRKPFHVIKEDVLHIFQKGKVYRYQMVIPGVWQYLKADGSETNEYYNDDGEAVTPAGKLTGGKRSGLIGRLIKLTASERAPKRAPRPTPAAVSAPARSRPRLRPAPKPKSRKPEGSVDYMDTGKFEKKLLSLASRLPKQYDDRLYTVKEGPNTYVNRKNKKGEVRILGVSPKGPINYELFISDSKAEVRGLSNILPKLEQMLDEILNPGVTSEEKVYSLMRINDEFFEKEQIKLAATKWAEDYTRFEVTVKDQTITLFGKLSADKKHMELYFEDANREGTEGMTRHSEAGYVPAKQRIGGQYPVGDRQDIIQLTGRIKSLAVRRAGVLENRK